MSTWGDLGRELDVWAASGRRATLWWRDDDVETAAPALDRLADLAAGVAVPIALAVVPAGAGRELAARLYGRDELSVLVHGLSHRNLAAEGVKKSEFPCGRPVHEMLADVATGWARLRLLCPGQALPVFVPPWNRMAATLTPRLPNAGIAGLSAFGPRPAADPVLGLRQVNCHVDLIDWRGSRGFVGEATALSALVSHLSDRRNGNVDGDEPTGILSHHLVLDAAAWHFLERLLNETQSRDGAHWLSTMEAFNVRT